MPNPEGYNGIDPLDESPYGSAQHSDSLNRLAPKAGGKDAASALNTPRRAQRRATRDQRPQAEAPRATPIGDTRVPAAVGFWQQVAQLPGVDPLVLELAGGAAR
jgi:hypothetical protein